MTQGFDGKRTFGEQVASGSADIGTVSERLAGSAKGLIEMPDHIRAGLPVAEVREPSRAVVPGRPGYMTVGSDGRSHRVYTDESDPAFGKTARDAGGVASVSNITPQE